MTESCPETEEMCRNGTCVVVFSDNLSYILYAKQQLELEQ
jgi:hypothetical protein